MKSIVIKTLPLTQDIETPIVLRKLANAHRSLAELKGISVTIPNEVILINTLTLQEAKDSSAIENIITTEDELFRSDVQANFFASISAKEVHHYSNALKQGFQKVRKTGLITINDLLEIQNEVIERGAGFRKLPGTVLKNDQTGAVVYTPPQHPDDVLALIGNLEKFINDDDLCQWDALTKMAVIHHQFESIHPFYDGNGRVGRIINVLYLVKQKLLKTPILYLSRYINRHKIDYYRLLQETRESENWQNWLLFMLTAVEQTANETIILVEEIKKIMQNFKNAMRQQTPKIYSQDLLNVLFRHPYTKIDFVINELNVSRLTAANYLNQITKIGLLSKRKVGRENYYINGELYKLLANVHKTD